MEKGWRLWVTHKDVVVPGKDGKLIQASDEVPTGSDVSSNKDANREDGERVHVLMRAELSNARSTAGDSAGASRKGRMRRRGGEGFEAVSLLDMAGGGRVSVTAARSRRSVLVLLSMGGGCLIPARVRHRCGCRVFPQRVRSTPAPISRDATP
jgi:hypothetical protein